MLVRSQILLAPVVALVAGCLTRAAWAPPPFLARSTRVLRRGSQRVYRWKPHERRSLEAEDQLAFSTTLAFTRAIQHSTAYMDRVTASPSSSAWPSHSFAAGTYTLDTNAHPHARQSTFDFALMEYFLHDNAVAFCVLFHEFFPAPRVVVLTTSCNSAVRRFFSPSTSSTCAMHARFRKRRSAFVAKRFAFATKMASRRGL
ncbi:hypothetical protein PLICRDRAFT_180934 [Plicaturopsis crispa FD-325 SS-3]|uniref:Uncharacterized protein n=1 Tax=Plicaturopsis crispa FD-325 SS-3 TaxID=944288 RepID=A0A0C9SPQ7_PLICR|nr:hypothetical protein PLICRDRAFT_180934 [Plicaturopsis crispa FD-325 SS-3]